MALPISGWKSTEQFQVHLHHVENRHYLDSELLGNSLGYNVEMGCFSNLVRLRRNELQLFMLVCCEMKTSEQNAYDVGFGSFHILENYTVIK